ncbi:MAG: 4'-phosphopantetheinyl transferase family protein, partial [Bacteroidota bacterium]
MTRIFYTCFEHQLPAHAFDRYLRSLPLNLQNDVMRYREWRDKHLVLFGKMLLREGLKYFRADNCTLDTIQYSAFKRPFFNNGIDFNISHTGKCVVCAISDTVKVGIDIEEITPIDILDFQGQWTGAEWSHITRSDSSHLEFFRCWTKKEAV